MLWVLKQETDNIPSSRTRASDRELSSLAIFPSGKTKSINVWVEHTPETKLYLWMSLSFPPSHFFLIRKNPWNTIKMLLGISFDSLCGRSWLTPHPWHCNVPVLCFTGDSNTEQLNIQHKGRLATSLPRPISGRVPTQPREVTCYLFYTRETRVRSLVWLIWQ